MDITASKAPRPMQFFDPSECPAATPAPSRASSPGPICMQEETAPSELQLLFLKENWLQDAHSIDSHLSLHLDRMPKSRRETFYERYLPCLAKNMIGVGMTSTATPPSEPYVRY